MKNFLWKYGGIGMLVFLGIVLAVLAGAHYERKHLASIPHASRPWPYVAWSPDNEIDITCSNADCVNFAMSLAISKEHPLRVYIDGFIDLNKVKPITHDSWDMKQVQP